MTTTLFPATWELVRTPPAAGAWNMACDLVLMNRARESGCAIVRVYSWLRPTISFGRNERTVGLYTPEGLALAGLDAVRRPTGGRALLHDQEITYSVSMPLADDVRWGIAYDHMNALLARALVSMGVPAQVAPAQVAPAEVAPPNASGRAGVMADGSPCFAGVSPGEIAVNGAKLVASAVWRERGAYLQHGSILLADTQARIRELNAGVLGQAAPAAVLSDYVDAAAVDTLVDTLDYSLVDTPDYSLIDTPVATSAPGLADAFVAALVKVLLMAHAAPLAETVSYDPDKSLDEIERVRQTLAQSSWLWRR